MIHAIHFYFKMNKNSFALFLFRYFCFCFFVSCSKRLCWVYLNSSKCANNTLIAHAILKINANTDTCHIKCIQTNSLFSSSAYTIHCLSVCLSVCVCVFLWCHSICFIFMPSHRHTQNRCHLYCYAAQLVSFWPRLLFIIVELKIKCKIAAFRLASAQVACTSKFCLLACLLFLLLFCHRNIMHKLSQTNWCSSFRSPSLAKKRRQRTCKLKIFSGGVSTCWKMNWNKIKNT